MNINPEFWLTLRRLLIHLIKLLDPELKQNGIIKMTHDETIIFDWIITNSLRTEMSLKELRLKCKELKRIP